MDTTSEPDTRPLNDYSGGPARTERELQLERHVAELEEYERERIANAQHQYTEAWNAYQRLLKRMGTAAGVELPPDLRYYKYENQIIAKITDLRAGQATTMSSRWFFSLANTLSKHSDAIAVIKSGHKAKRRTNRRTRQQAKQQIRDTEDR